jgi:DNA-binding GntR family transcriptional regulator
MFAAVAARGRNDEIHRDAIADALRDDIIRGRKKPGERLVEDAVAKEHGVSRVPVREALRRLESEGFVTLAKYQGAAVSTTSKRDSLELMQVRRGLEVMAARLAAERRGGDFADELTSVVDRGRAAANAHRLDELPDLIMSFHELVASAAGNLQLSETLHRVLQRISWGFELDLVQRLDSAWFDHAMIATAILSGSPTQAGILMDEHIIKDENLYRQRMDSDAAA